MILSNTLFLSAGSLFDFDLTFVVELTLFVILALVVTNNFVNPVSNELNKRSEFINYTLRKSTILLNFGYERLTECVSLLTAEISEMNRQMKNTRTFTNEKFETEVTYAQQQNSKILSKVKGDLSIKSAFLFANLNEDLTSLTDKFFEKKFKSIS
jgi:F0F1-type ATP synthase membrane subunit b/b'